MKDRVREAVFNLLGPAIKGTHAIDLFSGTGALALEAISRGAVRATAVERHFPTARMIRDNASQLGLSSKVEVMAGDTFIWAKRLPDLGHQPWSVFCCPPYALYRDESDEMMALIRTFVELAPPASRILVEADGTFDFDLLPTAERISSWDVRRYSPSVVGMCEVRPPSPTVDSS